MARFADGEGFDDPEDERKFLTQLRWDYRKARPLLREFLAYLDAMPVKRIISGRFVGTASHEMCSVATFCASKGFDWKRLLEIEKQSRLERFDAMESDWAEGDGGYGWDGATITAGKAAGLPLHVAYNLAWKNDMSWDALLFEWKREVKLHVQAGRHEAYGVVQGPFVYYYVSHIAQYRPITPEERWILLRNHVARQVGVEPLPGAPKRAPYPQSQYERA